MRKKKNDTPKFAILGHYGNGNLGDEAIVAAVIQSVKRFYAGAEVFGISMNPGDTSDRHKIKSFPIRRIAIANSSDTSTQISAASPESNNSALAKLKSLIKTIPFVFALLRAIYRLPRNIAALFGELGFIRHSIKRLRKIDLILIAGSGQLFDDWGGPFAYPYTLFKWTLMAKLTGTRVAFVSLGGSPLKSRLSRFFIKSALSRANYRSFRDISTQKLITGIGFKAEHHVFPDLAGSLFTADTIMATSEKVFGINPIPFCDARYWPVHDEQKYNAYVRKLADITGYLLDRGNTVRFFCTKQNTDGLVVRDVKKLLDENNQAHHQNLIDKEIISLDDLLESIAACDSVLASRFHGVLISLIMHKPVIGLAYEPKTRDLLNTVGLSEFCLDIDTYDSKTLYGLHEKIGQKRPEIVTNLAKHSKDIREKLDDQYRMIFDLLEG